MAASALSRVMQGQGQGANGGSAARRPWDTNAVSVAQALHRSRAGGQTAGGSGRPPDFLGPPSGLAGSTARHGLPPPLGPALYGLAPQFLGPPSGLPGLPSRPFPPVPPVLPPNPFPPPLAWAWGPGLPGAQPPGPGFGGIPPEILAELRSGPPSPPVFPPMTGPYAGPYPPRPFPVSPPSGRYGPFGQLVASASGWPQSVDPNAPFATLLGRLLAGGWGGN